MNLEKALLKVAVPIAIAWSVFQVYYNTYGILDPILMRATHVTFAVTLVFLTRRLFKRRGEYAGKLIILDAGLVALSVAAGVYYALEAERIATRIWFASPLTAADLAFSLIVVILVLEAARRTVGLPLAVIAVLFLLYAFFGSDLPGVLGHIGFSHVKVLEYTSLSTEGMYGLPVGVSATFVFMFMLFSCFLEKSGGGRFFIDLAFAATGRSRGGPAKAAVVGSSLFGTISGSAVANVFGTGVFTIPLMKKTGYKPHVAGAVEAVSSTGGQIMPPVMGAGAFVMAEILGISYFKIIIHAIIPAILYYVGVFMMVHLIAVKTGLRGLRKEELPSIEKTLRRGHLVIPLVGLVYFLYIGYPPAIAAFGGIVTIVGVVILRWMLNVLLGLVKRRRANEIRKEVWFGVKDFFGAMELGGLRSIEVAVACAAAGIVVGSLMLTGLALRFSSLIMSLSGGQPVLALVLLMVTALILGMGMPTTAAYITVAALEVPILIQMGFIPIAAHMFAFYFAVISMITPPVALAAYAGAAIAGADYIKTGVTATGLGLAAFIAPFMFIYNPSLLMIGTPVEIISAFITATIGVCALALSLTGYFLRKASMAERVLLFIAAAALIHPGLMTDLIGLGILVAVSLFELWAIRSTRRSVGVT